MFQVLMIHQESKKIFENASSHGAYIQVEKTDKQNFQSKIKSNIQYSNGDKQKNTVEKGDNRLPCGPVAGNPPAEAGNTDWVPGLGGSHTPRGS